MAGSDACGRHRKAAAALLLSAFTVLIAVALGGTAAADSTALDPGAGLPEIGTAEVQEQEAAEVRHEGELAGQESPTPAVPVLPDIPSRGAGDSAGPSEETAPQADDGPVTREPVAPGADRPVEDWLGGLLVGSGAALESPSPAPPASGDEVQPSDGGLPSDASGGAPAGVADAGSVTTDSGALATPPGEPDGALINDLVSLTSPAAGPVPGARATNSVGMHRAAATPASTSRGAVEPDLPSTAAAEGAPVASVIDDLATEAPVTPHPAGVAGGSTQLANSSPAGGGGGMLGLAAVLGVALLAAALTGRVLASGSSGPARANAVQGAVSGAGPPAAARPAGPRCSSHRRVQLRRRSRRSCRTSPSSFPSAPARFGTRPLRASEFRSDRRPLRRPLGPGTARERHYLRIVS